MKQHYTLNFAKHLADCEYNYRRMRQLMPGWLDETKTEGSAVEPIIDEINTPYDHLQWRYITGESLDTQNKIILQVKEFSRYTTTVHISIDSLLQKQLPWYKSTKFEYRQQRKGCVDALKFNLMQARSKTTAKNNIAHNLDVRLYHDATVAEVIAVEGYRDFLPKHEYPNRKMHQKDEKTQINLFLGELLNYCLTQGRVEKHFEFS